MRWVRMACPVRCRCAGLPVRCVLVRLSLDVIWGSCLGDQRLWPDRGHAGDSRRAAHAFLLKPAIHDLGALPGDTEACPIDQLSRRVVGYAVTGDSPVAAVMCGLAGGSSVLGRVVGPGPVRLCPRPLPATA